MQEANFGRILFSNSATAGSLTAFTNNGSAVNGNHSGRIEFSDTSTAGSGTFVNNGSTVSNAYGGETFFGGESTGGNATLIANGGVNGGRGGTIFFFEYSTGGTARVELFGNGALDISFLRLVRHVTVGSIEGNGLVFLGANKLTVGSNNVSTTFPE